MSINHISIFLFGYHLHCIEYYKPGFSSFQSSTNSFSFCLLNYVHIMIHSKRKITVSDTYLFYHLGVWNTIFITLSIYNTHSTSLIFDIFKIIMLSSSFPHNCQSILYWTLIKHTNIRFDYKSISQLLITSIKISSGSEQYFLGFKGWQNPFEYQAIRGSIKK